MRRRVYHSQTVGMGLRPGLVPAQYSVWVLGKGQEAVAHRITLLYGSCLGDISLSQTSYLEASWVAFSLPCDVKVQVNMQVKLKLLSPTLYAM